MDAPEILAAALSRRRFRVGLAIAVLLLGWWSLFVLAQTLTAPDGLARELLSVGGDLLGLAAAALALTTPWTAAQRARAAALRLGRTAGPRRKRD